MKVKKGHLATLPPWSKNEMNGTLFKQCFPQQMVKLTCFDEEHNGIVYKDGLNVDILPFHPKWGPGGMYFCTTDNIPLFFRYSMKGRGLTLMVFLREVIIPSNALVFVEEDRFKTNQFELGPRRLLFPLLSEKDQATYIECYMGNLHSIRDPAMHSQMMWNMLVKIAPDRIIERVPSPSARNKEGCLNCILQHRYLFLRFMPEALFKDKEVMALLAQHRVSMHFIPLFCQTTTLWSMVAADDAWWSNSKFDLTLFRPFIETYNYPSSFYAFLIQHQRITLHSIPEEYHAEVLQCCHETRCQQDEFLVEQQLEVEYVPVRVNPLLAVIQPVELSIPVLQEEYLKPVIQPIETFVPIMEEEFMLPTPSIKKRKKKARTSLFTRRK